MNFKQLRDKMIQKRIDHPLLNAEAKKIWFLEKIFLLILWMAWKNWDRVQLYELLEVEDA